MDVTEAFTTFGITVVTTVGTLWGATKIFANRWLEAHFAGKIEAVRLEGQKQLEAVKFGGQTQLEQLKHEQAASLDRAVKLNQREFEVIPEVWSKVTEAHHAVSRLIAVLQSSPELSRMSEPQFETFLAKARLEDWQRDEMRSMKPFDRTSYYSDITRWHRLNDATEAVVNFNRAHLGSSIFVHPDTHTKFNDFSEPLLLAYHRFRINMQMGDDYRMPNEKDDPAEYYRENGERLYNKLGQYLRERYWINAEGEAV